MYVHKSVQHCGLHNFSYVIFVYYRCWFHYIYMYIVINWWCTAQIQKNHLQKDNQSPIYIQSSEFTDFKSGKIFIFQEILNGNQSCHNRDKQTDQQNSTILFKNILKGLILIVSEKMTEEYLPLGPTDIQIGRNERKQIF